MKSDITNNSSMSLAREPQEFDEAESRFQKLWNEAERLKKENRELETTLDQLVLRIKQVVGPVEMDMARAMRVQIDKLILFGRRESLSQWQMVVLDEWIMSNMDYLQSIGLVDDELTDNLAHLHAQTLGFEVDANSDLTTTEQLAAYMESQLGDMDAELDDNDLIGGESSEDSDEAEDILKWHEQRFAQSEFENTSKAQAEDHTNQFSSDLDLDQNSASHPLAVFKTLFHRVARALHPDKETDPEKRQAKQALMAQLLEARRQNDLMTVFQMYQEHVDETASFGAQERAELEKVLCQFIELESQRQLEITTKTPLHDIAYTQYYSNDPESIEKAIEQKIEEVENRKADIEAFSDTVTSINKLGPYLIDRFERS